MVTAAAKTPTFTRAARAVGTIDGWTLAKPSVIAEALPEVGSVRAGSVALGIDAPVVRKAATAATTTVAVVPNTEYSFTAFVRQASRVKKGVGATFKIGSTTVGMGSVDTRWTKVSGTYRAGDGQTSVALSVAVSKAVRGLSIDDVVLSAKTGATAGQNVVPNSSFETVRVARGIANANLVMTTPVATIAAAAPKGSVTWVVSRGSKKVASGKATATGALTALPLTGVTQGYYTLSITASDRKTTKTQVAIVDSPNPWIVQDSRYGVGLHVESALYADAARYARSLGLGGVRNDVLWAQTEKKKGSYDFSLYQEPFDRLAAQGLSTLAIATYGNAVYGSANAKAPRNSAGLAAYGRYSAAMAKRFNLAGIEVFNEFNWPSHNTSGCVSAKCYLPLVKAVDAAVAKVDPKLPIVVGGTAKYQPAWFDDLWKRGGLKNANAVSFHPYEITGKPEAVGGLIAKARASMKKYGKSTRPVWLTELGTSAATGNRTQTQQASILLRSSTGAFAGGASRFYWYDLINDGPSAREHYHNFGLFSYRSGGVAALAPKEAGFVQALAVSQLGGRPFSSSEKAGSGVVSHAFGGSADRVRVVWAASGKKTATIKSTSAVVVVGFDGTKRTVKPKNGVVKLTVTSNPVFVRSGKATAGVTK